MAKPLVIKLRIDGDGKGGEEAVRRVYSALRELIEGAEEQGKKGRKAGEDTAKGFDVAARAIKGITVAAAAALGLGSLAELAADTLAYARAIGALSAQTGISAERLSVMALAAQQSELTLDDVARSAAALSKQLAAVQQGNEAAGASFRAIGLDAIELSKLPLDQAYLKIANALQRYQDGATKAAVVQRIFGEDSLKLTSLLNRLAGDGFAKTATEAQRLGVIIREQNVRAAEDLQQATLQLRTQVRGLVSEFTLGLAPALTRVAEGAGDLGREGSGLLRGLGAWLGQLAKAGTLVTGVLLNQLDPRKSFSQAGRDNVALYRRLFGTPEQVAAAAGPVRDAAIAEFRATIAALEKAGKEVEQVDLSTLSTDEIVSRTKQLGQRLKQVIQLEAADQLQIWKAMSDARLSVLDGEQARVRQHTERVVADASATFAMGEASFHDFFAGRRHALEENAQSDLTLARGKVAELRQLYQRTSAIRADGPEAIQARTQLETAENDVILIGLQYQAQRVDLANEEAQVVRDLNKERLDFEKTLLEAQGRTYEAALAAIDQQAEEFRRTMQRSGADAATIDLQVGRFRDAATARAQLAELQQQATAITTAISNNEARLQNLVNAGVITQQEATERQQAFIQSQETNVTALIENYENLRDGLSAFADPAVIAAIDTAIAALQGLQVQSQSTGTVMEQIGQTSIQSFGSAVVAASHVIVDSNKDLAESFKGLARSVLQAITDIILKYALLQPLLTGIAGIAGIAVPAGGFKFAKGGPVPGVGNRDTVPAWLRPREYVLTPEMVEDLGGVRYLERLRRGLTGGRNAVVRGGVHYFGNGGLVQAMPGAVGGGEGELVRVQIEHTPDYVVRVIESKAGGRASVRGIQQSRNAAKEVLR